MRRFLFGVVIASVTAAMPSWAFGGDREIAEGIMTQLQQAKSQGMLKGFDLDLKVESGVVYLSGNVRSAAQHSLVVEAVERTTGVAQLVDHLHVTGDNTKPVDAKRTETKTSETKTSEKGESRSSFFLGNAVKLGPLESQAVVPASADETALQLGSHDVAITDSIIDKLQQHKQVGSLKGFDLDVTTSDGEVSVRGKVTSPEQKALVLDIARRVRGVRKVIDDVVVNSPIQQVSNIETSLPALQPVPVPGMPTVGSSMPMVNPGMPAVGSGVAMGHGMPNGHEMQPGNVMPVVGNGASPRPFAPAMVANMQTGPGCYAGGPAAGGSMGGPVPMQAGGVAYGMGAPRYDQPYMPSYAWPSYAAYPNYAAVTYPKQYSPSAWPYIGPFYPYPQVPLGWRKVALEWDDGLWYLDFTSK